MQRHTVAGLSLRKAWALGGRAGADPGLQGELTGVGGCCGARRSLPAARVMSGAREYVSGRSEVGGPPPYPGFGGGGGGQLASQYLGGHRLTCQLYQLMLDCWAPHPHTRTVRKCSFTLGQIFQIVLCWTSYLTNCPLLGVVFDKLTEARHRICQSWRLDF